MIRLNVEVALYRRNSGIGNWPVVEVIFVSAITAAISYLVCGSIILLPSSYKLTQYLQIVFAR
jgi:surface polysaccharide O-acyltransferase-like enzyme